jgi:hypothetical protein
VLLDAEWMRVVAIDGDRLVVERAPRGTTAVPHGPSSLVHWGLRLVREVPVANSREDWNRGSARAAMRASRSSRSSWRSRSCSSA